MDPRTQQEEKRAERKGLVYIRQRYQVHGPRLEEDGEEGDNGEDGDREGYAYDPAEEIIGRLVQTLLWWACCCMHGWIGGWTHTVSAPRASKNASRAPSSS